MRCLLIFLCICLRLCDGLTNQTIQLNLTSFDCPSVAISRSEILNCTITTRDHLGVPTAGLNSSDFKVFTPSGLTLLQQGVQGGPVFWFLAFSTCPSGSFNIIVGIDDFNVSTVGDVLPAIISNFSLSCTAFNQPTIVAGSDVVCKIVTQDACGNIASLPWNEPSFWSAETVAAGLDGTSVQPVLGDTTAPQPVSIGELYAGISEYLVSFSTGFFWTAGLNRTHPAGRMILL